MEKFTAAEGFNNFARQQQQQQHFGQKATFVAGKLHTPPPPPSPAALNDANRRVEELNRWMAGKTSTGKGQQQQPQHKR